MGYATGTWNFTGCYRPGRKTLIALVAVASATTAAAAEEMDTQRLRSLLLHDCGSCHGLTLQGGLGPPLTARALEDRSLSMLINTILDGRPGTPMPGWRDLLSIEEVRWLAATLKRGVDSDEK